MKQHSIAALRTTLTGLTAAVAFAVQAQVPMDLSPMNFGPIEVVTGGIGEQEGAAIQRMAREYPLRVVISGRGGDYYVARDFKLIRNGEVVVDLPDAGPWVLADVPPGRYEMQGEFDGERVRRSFDVPRAGTTVYWALPTHLD